MIVVVLGWGVLVIVVPFVLVAIGLVIVVGSPWGPVVVIVVQTVCVWVILVVFGLGVLVIVVPLTGPVLLETGLVVSVSVTLVVFGLCESVVVAPLTLLEETGNLRLDAGLVLLSGFEEVPDSSLG